MYVRQSVNVFVSLLLWLFISIASAGKVGECRTECVERNAFKIVRVHLKETTVTGGICKNITEGRHAGAAMVTEFICTLAVGVWDVDLNSEDAVTFFPRPCPATDQVPEEQMADCPGGGSLETISKGIKGQEESNLKKAIEKASTREPAVRRLKLV